MKWSSLLALVALTANLSATAAPSRRQYDWNHPPFPTASGNVPASEQGWIIQQKTKTLGNIDLYLTPHAMKFVNKNDRVTAIMKAPDWRVYLFRDKPKLLYSCPLNKFESHESEYINRWHGEEMTDLVWAPSRETTIYGEPAITYLRTDFLRSRGKNSMWEGKEAYEGVRSGQYLVSKKIPISREECRVLTNLYNLPYTGYLPLFLGFRDEHNNRATELVTASLKKTTLKASLFQTPGKDYKLVNDEREVTMSGKQDAIDSMSKLLGDDK